MRHELEVLETPADVATAAADYVPRRREQAVADHGRFTFAVSGGHTPWAMFAELARRDMPWDRVVIYQVDERVAPAGDPDRNLTHLRESLGAAPAEVVPMPVNDTGPGGLEAAADGTRPAAGPVRPRPPRPRPGRAHGVARTGRPGAQGDRPSGRDHRSVPGPPADDAHLSRPGAGRPVLWLVTGADKREPLAKLLAGDESIPAGRVRAQASLVLADRQAAGR